MSVLKRGDYVGQLSQLERDVSSLKAHASLPIALCKPRTVSESIFKHFPNFILIYVSVVTRIKQAHFVLVQKCLSRKVKTKCKAFLSH